MFDDVTSEEPLQTARLREFARELAVEAGVGDKDVVPVVDAMVPSITLAYTLSNPLGREPPSSRPSRPEIGPDAVYEIVGTIGVTGMPRDMRSYGARHVEVDFIGVVATLIETALEFSTKATPLAIATSVLKKAWKARDSFSQPIGESAGLVLWAAWQDRDLTDNTIAAEQIPVAVTSYCKDFRLEEPEPKAVRRAITDLQDLGCLTESNSAPGRFEIERFISLDWR